jgi:hypothetical protein
MLVTNGGKINIAFFSRSVPTWYWRNFEAFMHNLEATRRPVRWSCVCPKIQVHTITLPVDNMRALWK